MVKNPLANAGDASLIPGSGRSPGKGNGNPLQYSCLRIPMDREAWRATVYWVSRVEHSLTTEQQQRHAIVRYSFIGIVSFNPHFSCCYIYEFPEKKYVSFCQNNPTLPIQYKDKLLLQSDFFYQYMEYYSLLVI